MEKLKAYLLIIEDATIGEPRFLETQLSTLFL